MPKVGSLYLLSFFALSIGITFIASKQIMLSRSLYIIVILHDDDDDDQAARDETRGIKGDSFEKC